MTVGVDRHPALRTCHRLLSLPVSHAPLAPAAPLLAQTWAALRWCVGAWLFQAEMALALGGEVDMWGEGVDEANFEPRVFPWASAVAERLWSPRSQTSSTAEAEGRLDKFRCLLVRRGIRAAPIGPGAPCY
jgi:hypothetical protein